MSPLARASELDRLLACPGSAWLPRAEYRSEPAKIAAAWGTKVHKWAETGDLPDGKDGALLKARIEAAEVKREVLWPPDGAHEVALAYNVVRDIATTCTSTEPGYKDRWKAAFDSEWVTGTADYIADVFGAPWVDDLKTGRLVHWKDYEAQQSLYVLAWCTSEGGLAESRSTLTHWPKFPITKAPHRFGATLSVEYLGLFKEKLVQLRRDITAQNKDLLSTGPQCTYCPSKGVCPKHIEYEEQNYE